MAPPMTVASEQNATARVPSTLPIAASMPESSSGVISSRLPSSKSAVSRCTGLRGSSSRGSFAGLLDVLCVAVAVMSDLPGDGSDRSEDDGDVGAAEAEGVVEGGDVALGQVAHLGGDVQLDLRVLV